MPVHVAVERRAEAVQEGDAAKLRVGCGCGRGVAHAPSPDVRSGFHAAAVLVTAGLLVLQGHDAEYHDAGDRGTQLTDTTGWLVPPRAGPPAA